VNNVASSPGKAGPPRVYLIDEREPVRRALVDRLTRTASVVVAGDGSDAAQALQAVQEGGVDIVLVEIKRADGMGLELVRQLTTVPGAPRVFVLTSYPTDWEEAAAKRAGASDYLLKDINTEECCRILVGAA
jgi:DNA-binding NarL/FixJ family response regulator